MESVRLGATHFSLSKRQRLDWLQLIRSENVGPATFRDLINHFGSANLALEALPELSDRAGKKSIQICPREKAEEELYRAETQEISFIGMGEEAYPQYLKSIDYPPPLLAVRGKLNINQNPPIGIVGARNSSLSGVKLAGKFAAALGEIPYHIVSGFARGIDAAAHRATLSSGTIGVMAGGVDVIFPPEHEDFYLEMLEQGNSFVSEMPLGFRPRAVDFPRRNRIIAGISLGVVVIEAAKRSGSLITARLTNEAGRLVFAVPGSPLDPRSVGANSLLKNGALIATCADDIVEEISPLIDDHSSGDLFSQAPYSLEDSKREDNTADLQDENSQTIVTDTKQSNRLAILNALGSAPIQIDELVRHCELPVSDVQLVLIELALAGKLEYHPGNTVSMILDG